MVVGVAISAHLCGGSHGGTRGGEWWCLVIRLDGRDQRMVRVLEKVRSRETKRRTEGERKLGI